MTSAYLRYPHVRQDLVAFVAADDVWVVGAEGGRAWRVTDDRAPVRHPRISPDGSRVAFVSYRDGHPELVVADLEGEPSRRLTYWGAHTTTVLGWADDERVLVASNAGEASIRHLVVKAVGLDGRAERLRYGPASGLALAGDGAVALTTPGSRVPAHWKRYRGGTAPRLWLDRRGAGDWERLLPEDTAGLVDPMWVDGRLLVVSDRAASFPDRADEQANLWVWDGAPGEGEPRQLTHQGPEQGYVRDAASDGHRVVWHSRGRLWLLDGLDGEPRPLPVTVPGAAPQPWSARPTERLHTLAPDHGGDASLVGWRGATFWLAHREGPARALVADSAVRTREPVLLGRTGRAALVTDAEGEDALEVHHVTGAEPSRRLAAGQLGRVLHLAADPAGERLAAITHDGRVLVVDVAAGSAGSEGSEGAAGNGGVRQVGHSPQGEAESPGFSPDGRYLLWSQPTAEEAELHQVMVLDTRVPGAEPVALTSGRYHDHDPAFTSDGRYVVLLSERTFDPQYDPHEFALSFAGSSRPWLIPLSATDPAPFGPSAEGWRLSTQAQEREKADARARRDGAAVDVADAAGEEAPPASPELDAAGAEDRIVPFPVPSAEYRDLRPAKDGVLWVEQEAATGELGSRRAGVRDEARPDRLQYWSFDKRHLETVVDKVDSYAVSGDGERVVVRHQDAVTVSPATHKPEEDDGEVVTVDLGRLRLQVDPLAEWRQMFDEYARLMRDHFWRADMDGVDWDAVVARWRPVVEQLRSHDDVEDLLWEVGGELNTSHAYTMPPEPPGDQERRLGLLGADLSRAEGGWRIDRVLPGESSEPDARSPLRAAG
ncbi:S41 family peptidase, partial [Ornithinicoccus halotolerans]|uniref:S41 family peptidase n=1 Tax=Ornithinicoccus halotolerans TaxID=1748220 RepID=UPI0012961CEA